MMKGVSDMKKWVILSVLVVGVSLITSVLATRSAIEVAMNKALTQAVVEAATGEHVALNPVKSRDTRVNYTSLTYGEEETGMFDASAKDNGRYEFDSGRLENIFLLDYGNWALVGPFLGKITRFRYGSKGVSVTMTYQLLGPITATILNGGGPS